MKKYPILKMLLLGLGIFTVLLGCSLFSFFCSFGFIDFPMDELGRDLSDFPTRQILMNFLITDTTNENPPTEDYDCKDYATDLKKNARNLGYRIRIYPVLGEQLAEYKALMEQHFNVTSSGPGFGHAVCKAYLVAEELWVTIEPQGDWVLNCTIGIEPTQHFNISRGVGS